MKTERKWPGTDSVIPMVSANLIHLRRVRSLLGRLSMEVDRLFDDPEGDFQLLGSLEDRDGADPSYFDQGYLGP